MRSALLGLGLLLLASPPASAQKQEDLPKWKIDPYTNNEPERYKAAGYENYHRFMVTDQLGTTEVMQALGDLEMIWVETKHFKIGSTLKEFKIPADKIQKERIAEEVGRLRVKMPEVPKKVKKLDPWLRVHLYAQRLEEEYIAIQELLSVTDESFPTSPGTYIKGRYMGEGVYMGQKNKFIVLLTTKKSTLHRFAQRWCDANFQADSPVAHNFHTAGCMLYGTSPELADGYFYDDARLHMNLCFGVAVNMLLGYKGYMFDIPIWIKEGIAHCYVNSIDARYHNFSLIKDQFPNEKKLWKWEPRVRKLVQNEAFIPVSEIMTWTAPDDFRIGHHMNIWSRVDYLIKSDRERFASFVGAMKDKFQVRGGTVITPEMMLERQVKTFQQVYNMTPEEFDLQWSAWVLETYPKK
jgi:hypothetical protein